MFQWLTVEVGQARAFGERTYDQLQQEKQSNAEQLEPLHRLSKRNNLVVFGVPELMAINTPAALACHMQGLTFQTATSSELTMVKSAFWLGKWRQDQSKPHAVLVELLSVAAKQTAFQAFKPLSVPEGPWLQRFFKGPTLMYRDGALIRKCAWGDTNKVVAAAAQAARATAPPPPRQQQAQEPRVTVAMDPSALLHQHGISLDQLSDPSSAVDQAAQAIIADIDSMMHASDDDVAS
ncbi:TPA: hypothetical protein ACH3X1_015161 [Trebouxia sp. C0004]